MFDFKVFILFGHPRCGKSLLLKRISGYYRSLTRDGVFIDDISDLDQVSQWVRQPKKSDVYLVLSSHFEMSSFESWPLINEEIVELIWIRRLTDARGRVLEQGFKNYFKEFKKRDFFFKKMAASCYTIPEGLLESDEIESEIWLNEIDCQNGILTVPSRSCLTREKTRQFFEKRKNWNLNYFELRTDLLSEEQQNWVVEFCPRRQLLFSVRTQVKESPARWSDVWDWPLELGACPFGVPPILSCHEMGKVPLADFLKSFENMTFDHLKLAIPILNLKELKTVHDWVQQDRSRRSFLPMSNDGRWSWYRSLQKHQQKINFLQEGQGTAFDQPVLYHWLSVLPESRYWSCVIGNPISHSQTPQEQRRFFLDRNLNIYAVTMEQEEGVEGFKTLIELGMTHAAVTSPLKTLAFEACQKRSSLALSLKNVNTLFYDIVTGELNGHNTDIFGFESLLKELPIEIRSMKIAVWGGGGTLSSIEKNLPNAEFFSVRNSLQRKTHAPAKEFRPEVVIWAVGRGDDGSFISPPEGWKPQWVLDLNYSEDSSGKEYSQQVGAQYVTGFAMFQAQAFYQRQFWGEISNPS